MVWALAALGLAFGLGSREVRRFESLAANDIASVLNGESKAVRVRSELNGFVGGALGDMKRVTIEARSFQTDSLPLFCEPERGTKGKVRELQIRLSDFVLGGLRVESLEATIPDCRFDYDLAVRERKIRLSRSGVGEGRVRLKEDDLEAFILRKFREIKRVDVRLDRNRVYVKGFGEFIVVQTDFEVIAKLQPVEGNKLLLTDAKVFFGEFVADPLVRDLVLRTLNPVVDIDADLGLNGAMQMEGLEIADGKVEAWGKAKIPDRPKPQGNLEWSLSNAPRTSETSIAAILFSAPRTVSHRSPQG
ncbi:MAG TPA: LmeA family phospholipid-binding protein [Fimbriimonadaceae bacterium]|nr:LmeA family phospholipid-binding protein [Fimbriimonadaceae bacterium]